MINYYQLSIEELESLLKAKKITMKEVFNNSQQQFNKFKDNKIFISDNFSNLESFIDNSQNNYNNNTSRPLEGIFVGIKDNITMKNSLTTCGSKILDNFVSDYDATVIEKLKNAGAIIVGKVNLDEFAMGSLGQNSSFGNPINPWKDFQNNEYCCGGSSSGSAAVVASGIAHVSLGTDTGGSVRLPAAWNGIVGFKPSYGVISRYGVIPMANSLDTVALFSRNVKDVNQLFNILIGYDKRDPSSVDLLSLYPKYQLKPKKKIAMIKEFNDCPDIFPTLNKVKIYLEKLGYIIEEISVPAVEYGLSLYVNIVPMEVMSNMARYDGIRYGLKVDNYDNYPDYITAVRSQGFGSEVQRRIFAGAFMASNFYSKEKVLKTYSVKRWIQEEFNKVFSQYDFVLQPTTVSYAVSLKDKDNINPVDAFKNDKYTVIGNLIGAPSIHIPIDLYPNDMPIGVSLMANCLQDFDLLNLAEIIDKNFNFQKILIEKVIEK